MGGAGLAIRREARVTDGREATIRSDEIRREMPTPVSSAEAAVFEAALATSEQRRLLAVEAAGVGDWTYDVARGTLVCSPIARAMHGVASGEPVTLALHDALIHP